MSATKTQQPSQPVPGLPDYLASPNAVLGDTNVEWRYGRAPDYSKTRGVWEATKKANHVAGSLPELVENLVKNWEIEASFKTKLSDWRTVDHEKYTFAINGGPPQTAEHMLKVGTYNAIIAPNEYYSPENSDFASSHKTFKRMMPTFAWEVIEVYSGPPRVSFKWRHWGNMKNDYVGFNDKGEKITAKAHGGVIDILGITVASVDDKVRLQSVDTYFDPLDMFRQIAPNGIVNKQVMDKKVVNTDKVAATIEDPHIIDGVRKSKVRDDGDLVHIEEALSASDTDASPEAITGMTLPILPKDSTTASIAAEDTPESGPSLEDASERDSSADWATSSEDDTAEEASKNGSQRIESQQRHDDENTAKDIELKKDAEDITEAPSCPVAGKLTDSNATQPATCPVSGRSRVASHSSGSGWEHVSNTSNEADTDRSVYSSSVTGDVAARQGTDYSAEAGLHDEIDEFLEGAADDVHRHPKTVEAAVQPRAGEAVAATALSEETIMTHEEMSLITPAECPFLMNRE